ncbi:MAG: hypothetical protein WCI11_21200 [Candidatus Methylumidiphilus sp.]
MPNSVAQTALKFAKAYTPLGPNNQSSGQLAPVKPWTPSRSPETKMLSNLAINRLKANTPVQGCAMGNVLAYARMVMNERAGNCFEQSALVCLFLSVHPDNPYFRLVRLAPPADHIFVAIGQAPGADGYFPDDFSAWNPNAVIIDPWVGISVKARHYPEIWGMKLDVMGAVGEELPRATGYGWHKANDASWRNAPTAHRKLSYTT